VSGTLYVVATPIGNLEDITMRALRVLGEVQVIACEDTRHTRALLTRYAIKTPTTSYHEHSAPARERELLDRLERGESIALVSDAGTPAISDPGYDLVSAARARDIAVVPIPGPSAAVAALSASGLPSDAFLFAGFLPPKTGARRARLGELASVPATLVFYEAPHRIAATLGDAAEVLGDRQAVIARELTKIHEEFLRGRLSDLASALDAPRRRGEFVLLVAGAISGEATGTTQPVTARVAELEAAGLARMDAIKQVARERSLPKREVYGEVTREARGSAGEREGA
jgi:16S rRNA (cytidine1402-2'-O)-methyltransferase